MRLRRGCLQRLSRELKFLRGNVRLTPNTLPFVGAVYSLGGYISGRDAVAVTNLIHHLINASKMGILSCSIIGVELDVDKRTMQELTERFKFSSRHADVKASFSRRPILRRPRPSGLDLLRMGAVDENIVLI